MWSRRVGTLAGLTSTATRTALGTSSCRSASRLATSSAAKKLTPVALPPGRARLATRPSLTGSSPTPNTIGIVAVAALAAIAAAGCRAWRSRPHDGGPGQPSAPAGDRIGPPASGTRPSRSGPRRSRFHQAPCGTRPHGPLEASADPPSTNPITGIAGCCARAASGHAAAPAKPCDELPPL